MSPTGEPLLLGIDLGTSYFKVGLFNAKGALRGLGRVAVEKQTPAAGRCEVPVELFWHLLRRGLDEALAQADAAAEQISGISYSSQATTFLLLDRHDEPLTPLVLWTDTRGVPVEPELASFSQTEPFRKTIGFAGLSGQTAAAKWRWFQRHEPELWKRTRRIMTIADYFTFALTGERVGDGGTAAFLGIYDLQQHTWWAEALARFEIDREKLSAPLRPSSPAGVTSAQATRLLGVPAGVPFAVGSLDHHVAAIGSGLERLADISISTGTVLAALAVVERPAPMPQCYHGPHVDGVRFYRLAFDPRGAVQLDEYQRREAPEKSVGELIADAERVSRGTAQAGAETERGNAVLTMLKTIAATHRALVGQVAGRKAAKIVATGGGARSPFWLQIKANMLGVPIVTPSCPERACLGAAAFAAVAAGIYPDIPGATQAMVHADRTFEPQKE